MYTLENRNISNIFISFRETSERYPTSLFSLFITWQICSWFSRILGLKNNFLADKTTRFRFLLKSYKRRSLCSEPASGTGDKGNIYLQYALFKSLPISQIKAVKFRYLTRFKGAQEANNKVVLVWNSAWGSWIYSQISFWHNGFPSKGS